MSKSFDEIVSNYKDPRPEWQVTVNGSDYTKNLELLEFTNSVNNPLEFTLKTAGLEGRNTDLRQGAEVVIKNSGFELFRGVLQQVDASTDRTATLKGSGYSAELDGDVSQNFKSTTVTNVVNTLIDSTTTDTVTSRTFSTAFDLSSTINVDNFRVNKTQLQDVNRLMGEYSTEWYLSYDGANNPVFNVTDQILNDDGSGGTIATITTYGTNQSAEVVKRNTNRNEGDYNGVIVRGYGDGGDQITATAGSTGKGNRVLIYTDKTILTQSQAQKRADNLLNSRSVPWREIRVKPNDPNKLYGIGDYLTVDAEDAKLDGDYRVIETYYKIYVGEEQVESKLVLSNKAQSFLSDFKTEEAKRESQTDYMQGARNIWGDKENANCSQAEPLTIDFEIPEDVKNISGENTVRNVKLNYSASEFRRSSSSTGAQFIVDPGASSENRVSEAFGSNFKDQAVYQVPDNAVTMNGGNQQGVNSGFSGGVSEGLQSSNSSGGFFNVVNGRNKLFEVSFTGDSAGLYMLFDLKYRPDGTPSSNTDYQSYTAGIRVASSSGSTYPVSSYVGASISPVFNANSDGSAWEFETMQVGLWIPENVGGNTYTAQFYAGNSGVLNYSVSYFTPLPHDHGVTPVHADSSGNSWDSLYVNDNQKDFVENPTQTKKTTVSSLSPNTSTSIIDVNDDVVAGAIANEVQIKVDGTDVTSNVYGSSWSGTNQDRDIDITSFLNTDSQGRPAPGWHQVKIIPDGLSHMNARVNPEHKQEST